MKILRRIIDFAQWAIACFLFPIGLLIFADGMLQWGKSKPVSFQEVAVESGAGILLVAISLWILYRLKGRAERGPR